MDVESYATETNQRLQRAIASVRREVRGLPHDVAVDRLTEALRHQNAFLPPDAIRIVARQLSDPWWHVRHPLRMRRQLRERPADTEGVRLEAEANELNRRVEAVADRADFSSYSIHSRRTVYGQEHIVLIEPWSASMARRITEAAAPIPVDVRPREAD